MRPAAELASRPHSTHPALKLAGLVLAAAVAASMWLYANDVLRAHQVAEAAAHGVPRGNLSDLYPRWLGARELLLHGRDPYGAAITREIQAGYYGRPLDPSRPHDPKDQQAFAYPLYVVFLLAPTVKLPFDVVQMGFRWLLVALTAASVPLWMCATGWRTSVFQKLIWVLLVLGCFPVVQGLKLQQLTLLVAAAVAGSMAAIVRRHFVWAGALLAVATIKPQLVVLLVPWLLVWVLGDWRERRGLLWTFVGCMAASAAGSSLLLPSWMGEFRRATAAYARYTEGRSELEVLLTPLWGRIAAGVLVFLVLALVWRLRAAHEQTAEFRWSMSVVLAATLLVIPMYAPHYQVLLLPGLMLVVLSISRLWTRDFGSRLLMVLLGISILWPWVAGAALVLALPIVPASQVERLWILPFFTTLMPPLVMTALLLSGRSILTKPTTADLNTA